MPSPRPPVEGPHVVPDGEAGEESVALPREQDIAAKGIKLNSADGAPAKEDPSQDASARSCKKCQLTHIPPSAFAILINPADASARLAISATALPFLLLPLDSLGLLDRRATWVAPSGVEFAVRALRPDVFRRAAPGTEEGSLPFATFTDSVRVHDAFQCIVRAAEDALQGI